ncbi:MAG TPA: hypothetical protein VM240_07285 [Verrucomicrobiae bacterium]|nr:hypothetical protein [Verrucomicrobiae bacterium]
MRLAELEPGALERVLAPYGLVVERSNAPAIPGSYWGESEAGLIANRLIVRDDTPVHSALHEACHWICAKNRDAHAFRDEKRVRPHFSVHTDAGGDDLEECAVCYLQVRLGDRLAGFTSARMLADMDAWGYSFRLGSARAWFEQDAADARGWLAARALLPQ